MCVVVQGGEGFGVVCCCLRVLCGARAAALQFLFALRPLPLTCAPLQVLLILLLWICTTVQQGHGRRLGSAWRAHFLQLHRSATWLCSLEVLQTVSCRVSKECGTGNSERLTCRSVVRKLFTGPSDHFCQPCYCLVSHSFICRSS